MSRSYHRNKPHLIKTWVGSLGDSPLYHLYETKPSFFWRYDHLPTEQAYRLSVVRYTRPCGSGRYGVPRWYRHQRKTLPERRKVRQQIHHAIRKDEWDDFLDERLKNNAGYFWW